MSGVGTTEKNVTAAFVVRGGVEVPIKSAFVLRAGVEVPIDWFTLDDAPPATTGFIAATHRYMTTDHTFTVPAGVLATDRMIVGLADADSSATPSITGCTAIVGPTDVGTMQGLVFSGTGYKAGDTVTVAGTGIDPSAVVAAWYRGVTSVGTPTSAVRSASGTTLTAPDPADDATGDLIVSIFLEKSGANTVFTAPAVAGVTNRAFEPWASSATGLPSAWIGDYSAPGSAKTITYLKASANGLASQVRLRLT